MSDVLLVAIIGDIGLKYAKSFSTTLLIQLRFMLEHVTRPEDLEGETGVGRFKTFSLHEI